MSQLDAYLGEIRLVGFYYAPSGWAQCNGQLLSVNEYPSLYTLLGTQYGGDGRTTFALPDYRGRAPIHQGQGQGLSQRYNQGERRGSDTAFKVKTGEGNQSVIEQQPLLVSNFIICLSGIFPSRS